MTIKNDKLTKLEANSFDSFEISFKLVSTHERRIGSKTFISLDIAAAGITAGKGEILRMIPLNKWKVNIK